jgi:hypothetical protein
MVNINRQPPDNSMQEFKTSTGNSLWGFFILAISFTGLFYLLVFLTTDFRLTQISFSAWLIIFSAYAVLAYLYTGFTNNDILVFDDRIEIVNRLPLFKKHYRFQLDKIKSMKFRHEWTETFGKSIKPSFFKYIVTQLLAPCFFPADYKWIRVCADKDYKFYCFGIEMDYYDNEGPLFEDLFNQLAGKGVNVSWTDTTGIYYSQMTKNAENKKLQTGKAGT